ncbi:hypothetical protein KJ359_001272 [Pestalotiopsis sp. 9143b]|nr:hypothetical protein KJ359_001272 [Pestalotiopsis sp. 9143b]
MTPATEEHEDGRDEPTPEVQGDEPADESVADVQDEPVAELQGEEVADEPVNETTEDHTEADGEAADQTQDDQEPAEAAPENEAADESTDEWPDIEAYANEERVQEPADETPARRTRSMESRASDDKLSKSAAPARIYALRSSTRTPMKAPGSADTPLQRSRAATEPTGGRRQSLRLAAKTPSKVPLSDSTPVRVDSAILDRVEGRRQSLRIASNTPSEKRISTSKYFATPKPTPPKPKSPRPPRGTVSALPFPTLSAPRFGLIQEELASDPFRLLIAITFLVRTPGKISVPVFYELMENYPTPQALLVAGPDEIASQIKHLGLSVVRTAQIQKYARVWIKSPPSSEVRYGVKNYPVAGDGSDVRAGEQMPPESEDPRASAWEIGHMTQGPYAIDSWRIFCRDVLLGRAQDWKGKGREPEFQPEWMRVMPSDKELRAYLRWMWMKEGWDWDPKTGDKTPLSVELRDAVDGGRVQWDNSGALQIVEGDDELDVEDA